MACGGGGSGSGGNTEKPTNNTPPVEQLHQSQTPHLGLAIFALLHPQFNVDTAFELLNASKDPVIAFLPGVFGSNLANYEELVARLEDSGKAPHIHVYALCGPCRIPRRDGSLVQFRKDLDIDGLNDAIRWNPEVRSQFLDRLTNEIKPIVDKFPELQYTIVPELEDNQNDDSFTAMLDLTNMVFGPYSNVRYARNAMSASMHHSYNGISVKREFHNINPYSLPLLGPGDTMSFDGSNFRFPGEYEG